MIFFDLVQLLVHLFLYKDKVSVNDLVELRRFILIELVKSKSYRNTFFLFDFCQIKQEVKYFPNHITIFNDEFICTQSINPEYFKDKNPQLHEIIQEATNQWAKFNNLLPLRQSN
jgi:hypothetical protein